MRALIIQPRRKFFNLSIWVSLLLIYTLLLVETEGQWVVSIIIILLLTLLSAATIYRVWLTLIPKYLQRGRGMKFTVSLLAWLLLDAMILQMCLQFMVAFYPRMKYEDLPGFASNGSLLSIFMCIVIIAWSMIIIARNENEAQLNTANLEKQLAESESQRKQLELEQLKSQLQPHFLFNTLNTIYGAALQKADHTPEMIMELSAMLDYGLYHASKEKVPLADELMHLKRYLNLEKKRFRDGLFIRFDQSGQLDECTIPPLLLMPLVENAMKHGRVVNGQLPVDLHLAVNENQLLFSVKNPSKPSVEPKGIGLENLRKRLNRLFPTGHELIIDEKDDTFEATLKLSLNQ